MEEIVNKVAKSGLITLDLEEYYPKGERVLYDIKDNLWQGIALKEKEFRAFVKENDWSAYKDKYIALHCSVDAIVPTWAYMLLTIHLQEHAKRVVFGDMETLESQLITEALEAINPGEYKDARVIIKGCGNIPYPEIAYVAITNLLKPEVKSLMYGEACSSVPIYKRK